MAPLNPPKSPSSWKKVYLERVYLYLVSDNMMLMLAFGIASEPSGKTLPFKYAFESLKFYYS